MSVTSADIPSAAVNSRSAGDAGCFAVVGAPELGTAAVPELLTAACAMAPVAGQIWLVLEVCMPWRRDAPPPQPRVQRTAPRSGARPDRLDAALERLAPAVDSRRVLLAGDLNQTLSGRNVGFAGGRRPLEEVLSRHRLVAYHGRGTLEVA